jgi:hypothetical protein
MHQEWSQGPATEPPRATVPKGCGFTEAKPGETKSRNLMLQPEKEHHREHQPRIH